jgi:HAD superfamily hydrolase (TIGR01509 family)
MDGLLVDSEPLWSRAESDLLADLGGPPMTLRLKAAMMGKRLDAAVPLLLAYAGSAANPQAAAHDLLTRVVALFREGVVLRPGAAQLLAALAAAGVPCALVSSSYRVLVDTVVAQLGSVGFVVTVAGDEVRRGKPHPEPYLTAAARLGCPPAACVALEDSLAGVASARAAGCAVVAVPSESPIPPGPGRMLAASLEEIDLARLAALAASG